MTTYQPKPVNPKTVKGRYEGQVYTLTFNPKATNDKQRWYWSVTITKTYDFGGYAPSEEKALRDSKREIEHRIGKRKVV